MSESPWGKRGQEGPPDLDALLRKFNARITNLLSGGGKRPSSGGSGGQGAMVGGAGLIASILLVLWLATGFYTVDQSEAGVLLRFGRFRELTGAGLNWHIPYPFEEVEIVNQTGVRSVEIGYRDNPRNKMLEESLMVTGDQNIVDVQLSVQYTLNDPRAFVFNNVALDADARDIVKQVGEAAIREVVGKNQVDRVLNEGREKIAVDVKGTMQTILDRYATGVHVTQVNISNAQPPEQVQAAFDDAIKAGQDKDKQKSEGEAYFNDVVPKARGIVSRLSAESQGYRQRVISNAQGDASRFKQVLAEYSKAPTVTRQRMYLDTVQQILMQSSKILVDQKNGNSLIYLPLDKLMQTIHPNAPMATTGELQKNAVPVALVPLTARDARDRQIDGREGR